MRQVIHEHLQATTALARDGKHAADFLGEWQGALMVDDYGGYKAQFAKSTT